MTQDKKTTNKSSYQDNEILKNIYLLFAQAMKTNLVLFFQSVDDAFNANINDLSQDDTAKRQVLEDQINSIRIHKLNVLSSYLNSIKTSFKKYHLNEFDYFEDKITKVVKKSEDLNALIDKNDIAEKQKQNSLIHQYEKKHIRQMFLFKQRLSLISGSTIDSYKLPFGPFVMVSAFAKSIRLLHLDIDIKYILYEHFQKIILDNIEISYKRIAEKLSNSSDTNTQNKIALAKKEEANEQNSIDSNDIKKALAIVQNNIALKDPIDVKNNLIQQLNTPKFNGKKLNRVNKNNIDLMTMMFQLIYNDKSIPENIQLIIVKLIIPYIKASLDDRSLLEDKNHPAKLLINLLTKASLPWTIDQDKNKVFIHFYKTMVDEIFNHDELNLAFFKEKLDTVQKFLNSDKNQFTLNDNKSDTKEHGRGKIMSAMKTVEAILNHKMDGKQTPLFVKSILLGPWKNLLVLLLVRHSNSSDKYLEMLNFIDDLFETLGSEQFEFVISNSINSLCDQYAIGLKLIAYNPTEIEKQSKELKKNILKFHKSGIKLSKPETPAETLPSDFANTKAYSFATVRKDDKSDANNEQTNNSIYDGLIPIDKQLVKSIEFGKWLNFVHKNGKHIKAKLSWINPKTNKFLFVNERGLKITDKTAQQLADDLKNKRIIIEK